jgi:hypothetical protein
MEFTKEFKEKVKTGDQKFALAQALGVSFYTVVRYLNLSKSEELTKLKRINQLYEFCGLRQEEIFEKQTL